MKKYISILCAVALIISLYCIPMNAKFIDDDSISYGTAIDYVTEKGIMVGYANGTFAPKDTLTRAAAAKLLCFYVLGSAANNLPKSADAVFNDVPATHWAAAYINYCYEHNIVGGTGNGDFAPEKPVTNVQFQKMLISAMGVDDEHFHGMNWELFVTQTSFCLGLFCNMKYSVASADALNRETAALYLYNAMTR